MAKLIGFSVLPADTFAEGTPSGAALTNPTNGRETPFPSQPVQGFSGVQFAPGLGGDILWFLSDNGFGSLGNSADYLLRLYQATPQFSGGTLEIQGFIQLSDPQSLAPFPIVRQETPERWLTGADFDLESFVLDAQGNLWIGEEFGPYLLQFNGAGELLSAPIPTPNFPLINPLPTLNGQAPLVIGHRGASGELPEHTLEAYRLAILRGADFIEPDLVATSDGVLIARHEPILGSTTDVGNRPEFADRRRDGVIDGVLYEDEFFASDFTLAEIKTLRAVMPQSYRTDAFDGVFQIPTLGEIIDLVKQVEADTGKTIGIYPETKHPTYHDDLGLSLEEKLLDVLVEKDFIDPSRIFIQSFEVSNLKELNAELMPALGLDLPLVQLLDAYDIADDGSLIYQDVNARPYDFVVNGDNRTYADLQTPEGLAEIATYADGIGPWKPMILSSRIVDENGDGQADDLNGDGVINTQDRVNIAPSSLIPDAHSAGLFVHAYTFRNEPRFLTSDYANNPEAEYRTFINLGVDGYFTDFPGTGDLVRDQMTAPWVRSPQNPAVLSQPDFATLNGQTPIVIGHRGASGERPEHTLEAYRKAIADGADFIEPDLVVTQDGVLIARHEPMLAVVQLDGNGNILRDENNNPILNTTDTSTDIFSRPEFADRLTVKNLDGVLRGGWFAEDLTLAEIKTLNAIERIPAIRGTEFDQDGLKVPTLAEVIQLVQQVEAETGRKIGLYPETKHPTFFLDQGYDTSQLLVETLVAEGFTNPSRIFIQSFEVANLQGLKETLLPAAGLDLPLVQLFGGAGRPYDFVVSGDPRTYSDLATPTGLAEIAAYADGIGPNKQRIVPLTTVDTNGDGQADDLNGDGVISDGDRVTGVPTSLINDAHSAGLFVHLYTLRNDDFFLPASYEGDPKAEYRQFIDLGVDGFFTDFPATGAEVVIQDYLAGTGFRGGSQAYYGDLIPSNLAGSRGFEGMAFSPDRSTLYPLLEGTVVGDPAGSLRIYRFDVASAEYQGLVGFYGLDNPGHAIGDFTPINNQEFLVIERDNGQGATAAFKKIFKVNFSQIDDQGFVAKEEVADLLNISDPDDLNGDGESAYSMPFVTIENVLVIDSRTILVANDNNYPFSQGRPPEIDNTEVVLLELATPLALDPRLGRAAAQAEAPQLVSGTAGDDLAVANDPDSDIAFDGVNDTIFTGAGNDEVDTLFALESPFASGNRIFSGSGDDLVFVNNRDRVTGGSGADEFDASDATGYRLSGGEGDDLFFLGQGGRVLGGDGADRFLVGTGGDNLLSGGAGADQFWLLTDKIPEDPNIVTDFTQGVDVIGILGQGSGVGFENLTFDGGSIALNGAVFATLSGFDASALTAADVVFM
ncbi:MAG: glycerophosphodiester phosphodiesterase family protein [Cyanobacteriota bacterium]